jgi:hypothetical protein
MSHIQNAKSLRRNNDSNRITPDRIRPRRLIPIRPRRCTRGDNELDIPARIGQLPIERRAGDRDHVVAITVATRHRKGVGSGLAGGDRQRLRADFEEVVFIEGVEGPEDVLARGVGGFAAAGGGEDVVFENSPV